MERRSGRGKKQQAPALAAAVVGGSVKGGSGSGSSKRLSVNQPLPSVVTSFPLNLIAEDVPPAVGEEVVLSKKGTRIRQGKGKGGCGTYYPDAISTSTSAPDNNWRAASGRNSKKMKEEPVDIVGMIEEGAEGGPYFGDLAMQHSTSDNCYQSDTSSKNQEEATAGSSGHKVQQQKPGINYQLVFETITPPKKRRRLPMGSRTVHNTPNSEERSIPNLPGSSSRLLQQPVMAVLNVEAEDLEEAKNALMEKRIANEMSMQLRNLLKLPKAHKWVYYEWFYSTIDKALFECNLFEMHLKECFPKLKQRQLRRVEWVKLRRLMGKPRRLSAKFFVEERVTLARKRQMIRQLHQRKPTDFSYRAELPDEVPLQLVVGSKVTARVRTPSDGLFTGRIEAVDFSDHTYRITFDRPGLGTHSIPDYEVSSDDPVDTVPISSFALFVPRQSSGIQFQAENLPNSPFPPAGMLGGFPIRFLEMIVRLSKLLKVKREKIMLLKELNTEAELLKMNGVPYKPEFRTRYAECILQLGSINNDMEKYMSIIQPHCLEIAKSEQGSSTSSVHSKFVIPEQVRTSCDQDAATMVSTFNCKPTRTLVHNQKMVGLIQQMTSMMLQFRELSEADRDPHQLQSIKVTLKNVKASLEGKNLEVFQNKIEIPMNRMIAGICSSERKAFSRKIKE